MFNLMFDFFLLLGYNGLITQEEMEEVSCRPCKSKRGPAERKTGLRQEFCRRAFGGSSRKLRVNRFINNRTKMGLQDIERD
jgi:hypothetical protein